MGDIDRSVLSKILPEYYKRIFPLKPFYRWLTYGRDLPDYFQKRELAFILDGDVHLRFRSFEDEAEFQHELCKNSPHKLDIGAVYNHKPKDRKKFADFRALERELVFDIDLTDYDEIRACCSDAKVCTKCWRWICIAVGLLDVLLEKHFGFKHRLWVFSGRRGVHCWVADSVARKLSIAGRTAVVEYLSLVTGGQKIVKAAIKRTFVHPLLDDAYSYIVQSPEVSKLMLEQGWMSNDALMSLLDGCINDEVQKEIQCVIEEIKSVDMEKRWNALRIRFDKYKRAELKKKGIDVCEIPSPHAEFHFRGYVLQRAYPRLDVHVSTGLNHLLKSPFCVHPKTGLVAVPIRPNQISEIDLTKLPRIDMLMNEISKLEHTEGVDSNPKASDYKHCSLGQYVETFEQFVDSLIHDDQHSNSN